MTGRPTKYNAEIHKEMVSLVAAGCVIEDVCKKVGITKSVYHDYLNRYPDFANDISRARSEANIGATITLRRAMAPHDETTTTTKTFTETRLRKNKDGSQTPFEYSRVEVIESVAHQQGDWRAALEFLRRRDPEHWTEKLILAIQPEWAALFEKYGLTASTIVENVYREIQEQEQRQALTVASTEANEGHIIDVSVTQSDESISAQ